MIAADRSPQKRSAEQLASQNEQLRRALKDMLEKCDRLSEKFKVDMKDFAEKSKLTLNELNQQVIMESSEANKLLHNLTGKYETALQRQIDLLTLNQQLVQEKEEHEQNFSKRLDAVTGQYEQRIAVLEATLKSNVKKVTKLQGPGMLQALMKNARFQEEVKKLGGDIDRINQGMAVQSVVRDIADKDAEIKLLTQNNNNIEEEVKKTEQMMTTFGKLLDNMQQEKLNLTKQNIVLLQKLKQSREILAKLIPAGAGDEEQ